VRPTLASRLVLDETDELKAWLEYRPQITPDNDDWDRRGSCTEAVRLRCTPFSIGSQCPRVRQPDCLSKEGPDRGFRGASQLFIKQADEGRRLGLPEAALRAVLPEPTNDTDVWWS
jgi:hypothetical protein